MDMVPVESSNLEAVGYDAGSQVLHVRFKGSGRTYAYGGVTPAKHQALMKAPSKGKNFANQIRLKHPAKLLE